MVGKTVKHYRIIEKLGSGGMGDVYVADNLHLNNRAALKFLPPHLSRDEDAKKRFIQEAQSASALNHPNVCAIYDIDEADDGQLFMAMALYEGQTLKAKMADGSLPVDEAVEIAMQVAEGLAAAHEKGIIHRDIKPANILITEKGRAVILDFGLAKLQEATAVLTASGSTLGTAAYMSPEQARGEAVDHGTDIWSLGVVLYEMLAGERPFKAEYQQALVYQILNEEPTPIAGLVSDLPKEVRSLVDSCLSKDSVQRPDAAAIIVRGLASDTGFERQRRSAAGVRPWMPVIGLVAVAALTLYIAHQFQAKRSDSVTAVSSAIAVLPFSVEGDENLSYLRTGMVRLLSTRLDGLDGLRSLDPNVVLSQVSQNDPVTINDGSSLSRRFGLEGFILGSMVRAGRFTHVSASLYEPGGSLSSNAEIVIEDDSLILDAVDRLAMKLLADRLEQSGQERQSLAALSTYSYEALVAYLKGEAAMRELDLISAQEEFQKAVDADSTFALAWYRLAMAAGWPASYTQNHVHHALATARRQSTRLSRHYQFMLDGYWHHANERPDEARLALENALALHPDNAMAWNLLGEVEYHWAPFEGRTQLDARPLLVKALELDPGIGREGRIHLIEIAIEEREFRRAYSLAPVDSDQRYALSLALATDESSRQAIADSLNDNLPTVRLRRIQHVLIYQICMPRLAALLSTDDTEARIRSIKHSMEAMSGRIIADMTDAAFAQDHQATWFFDLIYFLSYYPFTAPELSRFQATVSRIDSVEYWPFFPATKSFALGMLDWRMGDMSSAKEVAAQLIARRNASPAGKLSHSLGKTLEGVVAWSEGNHDEAIALTDSARFGWISGHGLFALFRQALVRFLQGEVLRSSGDCREALRWYRSVYAGQGFTNTGLLSPTLFRLGQCHSELGNADEAIHYYTRFIDLWQGADDRLQPLVQEARESMDRLVEEQAREPN